MNLTLPFWFVTIQPHVPIQQKAHKLDMSIIWHALKPDFWGGSEYTLFTNMLPYLCGDYFTQTASTCKLILPNLISFDISSTICCYLVQFTGKFITVSASHLTNSPTQSPLCSICGPVVDNWGKAACLPPQAAITKLRTILGKFGEFWALIAYFWLAWVRHNHFVNTIFSKLSKEIADPYHY